MIICAAIKLIQEELFGEKLSSPKELVICGHRHGDCLKTINELSPRWCHTKQIQGFINHKGEFLDRKEAFKHIQEIGQCNATQRYYWEDHNQDELYSEDLY